MTNQITWSKPDPPPNTLHTAFTHAHETLLWASKGKGARHTFNYDLINSPDPASEVSSVWHIPAVPMREKYHGRHPTQKPLRLLRRAVLASSVEGDLVFDPFSGSGTTGVADRRPHVTLHAWVGYRGDRRQPRGCPARPYPLPSKSLGERGPRTAYEVFTGVRGRVFLRSSQARSSRRVGACAACALLLSS
jgi:DNA methylase